MKLARLAAVCVLVWVTGCSGFDQDYKAAVEKGWAADSIEGPWEGRWQSKAGHGGDGLKAIMVRTGQDTYFVRFRAKYWGIFASDQQVNLRSISSEPFKARGTEDLGYLKGGWYQYEATITPERFDATYKSEHDHGDFNLARPAK